MNPLPSISRVFSIMIEEERQKSIYVASSSPGHMLTMATRFDQPKKVSPQFRKKDRAMCSHCNIPGHAIDQCFKLRGYPPGYKPKPRIPKSGTASQASIHSESETGITTTQSSNAPIALNEILQNLSTSQCQQLVSYFSTQLQSSPPETSILDASTGLACCVTVSSSISGICYSAFRH